jgi:hypothetical protein
MPTVYHWILSEMAMATTMGFEAQLFDTSFSLLSLDQWREVTGEQVQRRQFHFKNQSRTQIHNADNVANQITPSD